MKHTTQPNAPRDLAFILKRSESAVAELEAKVRSLADDVALEAQRIHASMEQHGAPHADFATLATKAGMLVEAQGELRREVERLRELRDIVGA